MKKTLAFVLCLAMIVAIAVSSVSADEAKKLDARELQQYGQIHYYLPPVPVTDVPDVTDGVIGEDEYYYSFDFILDGSNPKAYFNEGNTVNGFTNTEWAKAYMSFDGEKFYMAMQTKDNYYVIDKDMFYINLGFADGGTSRDAVERLRFDIEEDATTGKPKYNVGEFFKNQDGSWEAKRGLKFEDFVTDATVSYDETTQIFLFEAAWNVQAMMEQWENELDLEDVRMYFNPMIRMQGGSAAGATDGPLEQGYVWHYMGEVPSEIKLNHMLDYPEESYYAGMFPNIVHFCEEPEPTTPAPTTTAEPTTTPEPTDPPAIVTTTAKPTTAAPTDAPVATTTAAPKDEGGCGGTIALSAIALVPMLGMAVVFGKKRED